MKFFRNNWYWVLGIVIGLGIGSIIAMHRAQQQDTKRRQHVERKTSEETSQNLQKGRGKTRGNMHTAAHSHTPEPQNSERRERIPQEVSKQLNQLYEQYKDKVIGTRSWESKFAGPQHEKVRPDEYYEKQLEILCGDMDPEQAADYLETLRFYSRALLKRLDTVRAYQHLKALGYDMPEVREYAERVIVENPGTSIEFEARYYIADKIIPWSKEFLAEKVAAYQAVLEIDPNFQGALSGLGAILVNNDKPAEAIPYLKKHNSVANPGHPADAWLGQAYEKLGDVKTAWIYYKRALTRPSYHENEPLAVFMRHHIERIEVGDPIFKPVPQVPSPVTDGHGHENPTKPHGAQERTHSTEVLPDVLSWTDLESTSPQDIQDRNAERRRAAAEAAQRAHDNFLRHQELSQKELDDFLQWTESIMNADAPMDTNNFLMKEMEAHLKGGQTQFDPDRIVRAFETMERYGAAEGIKQLQKADPDLAKQVQRLLTEKRTPHQNKKQNRK